MALVDGPDQQLTAPPADRAAEGSAHGPDQHGLQQVEVHVRVVVGQEALGVQQRGADVGEREAGQVLPRVVEVVFLHSVS